MGFDNDLETSPEIEHLQDSPPDTVGGRLSMTSLYSVDIDTHGVDRALGAKKVPFNAVVPKLSRKLRFILLAIKLYGLTLDEKRKLRELQFSLANLPHRTEDQSMAKQANPLFFDNAEPSDPAKKQISTKLEDEPSKDKSKITQAILPSCPNSHARVCCQTSNELEFLFHNRHSIGENGYKWMCSVPGERLMETESNMEQILLTFLSRLRVNAQPALLVFNQTANAVSVLAGRQLTSIKNTKLEHVLGTTGYCLNEKMMSYLFMSTQRLQRIIRFKGQQGLAAYCNHLGLAGLKNEQLARLGASFMLQLLQVAPS